LPPTFGLIVLLGFLWNLLKVAVPISVLVWLIAFFASRYSFLRHSNNKQGLSLSIASGAAILVCGVLIFGQIIFPLTPLLPRTNPTAADLVGTWVPTDVALQKMADNNFIFSIHRITINPDGTMSMVNVPGAWINPNKNSTTNLYSGNGTWEMLGEGKEKKVQITLNSINSTLQLDWLYPTSEFGMNLIYFRLSGTDNFASFEKCGAPFLRMKDERFAPFLEALSKIDRNVLGFTPISLEARVDVEGTIGETDVMLHIYDDTRRTVTFKQLGNSYQWTSEQEIHEGKDKWTDYDGALWVESITIEYQTENINGIPLNTLWINYIGRDSMRSTFQDGLTLKDVQPIIEEWRLWRQTQPPLSVSLCP
jgi:hypothetical protein